MNWSRTLEESNRNFQSQFPGEPTGRQPIHTVYGGAHLFKADIAAKMKKVSLNYFREYCSEAAELANIFESSDLGLWDSVHPRVLSKLETEALEDFRIDFEDGYGNRSDQEEDGHAEAAANEVARGLIDGILPPFIGIRIKPFTNELYKRSARTAEIFVKTLINSTDGNLPDNFVITIPKVTHPGQTEAFAGLLDEIENKVKLQSGSLKFEIMVETTQAIIGHDGRNPLKEIVQRSANRCVGAHFGTYDYTASCNITAVHQTMNHGVCDFAKHMMKVALTGSGLMLSDGATNVMPVGPHRPEPGQTLTPEQQNENREVVWNAWRLSASHIRHSLVNGYYQGWDLHPGQLPIRYATVFSFFRESLESTTERLSGFIEKAARATLLGDVFDDAATGQGLLNFFLRGLSCGALSEKEVLATGLTVNEVQSRSFLKILEGRKKA